MAGTPFWNAARRAFKKVRASLSHEALHYIERFADMFHQTTVGASNYTLKAELIDELMVGIEDRRATFITYQSLQATEPVTYDIYPYGMAYHRGSLYLAGWAPEHQQLRHWKVDRIESAEVTEFRFERPKDFDLAKHFGESFGVFQGNGRLQRVTIRFSKSGCSLRARRRMARKPEAIAAARTAASLPSFSLGSTEEIKRWVLGFGREAEILAPKRLREEMAEELLAMQQRYEGSDAATACRLGRGPINFIVCEYVSHAGSRPISIVWATALHRSGSPLPHHGQVVRMLHEP